MAKIYDPLPYLPLVKKEVFWVFLYPYWPMQGKRGQKMTFIYLSYWWCNNYYIGVILNVKPNFKHSNSHSIGGYLYMWTPDRALRRGGIWYKYKLLFVRYNVFYYCDIPVPLYLSLAQGQWHPQCLKKTETKQRRKRWLQTAPVVSISLYSC